MKNYGYVIMAQCAIYDEQILEKYASAVLNQTNAFDGKSTQLITLASAYNLDVYNARFLNPEVSGMLRIEFGKYNIYINTTQPVTRQRFTTAHEISHFLLHRNLIEEQRGSILYRKDFNSSSIIERQANFLAAALLMPHDEVLRAWRNLGDVQTLAEIFETSVSAMYVRLNKLGALNE